MARRAVLTTRQREALFALPTDEATFLRHYVLSEDDLAHVRRRRRDRNRLGFALQLCASRYPGRLLRSVASDRMFSSTTPRVRRRATNAPPPCSVRLGVLGRRLEQTRAALLA